MLLRISLILAILAGLGVIGVSQFMLKPHIEEIITERNKNKKGWDDTAAELKKTNKKLKETNEDLTKTKSTLEETKGQLVATTTKFETEQKRANGLQEDKNRLSASLKSAQDDLHAWTNSGVKVEQIPVLVSDLKNARQANEGLQEEHKVLLGKIDKQQKRIEELIGKEQDVPVPHSVRGKVLVVDPKWDFLVLDVGAKNEVPQRGVLLISRNGELVAKVRVTAVQDQRSIANIMPGWKIKDVMEGDLVLAY